MRRRVCYTVGKHGKVLEQGGANMAEVVLSYRDGNNYKCFWDISIPDEVMRGLPEPDSDGQHSVTQLGLTIEDIPLIADYGYDETADHPYVTIEKVEYKLPPVQDRRF